MKVETRSGTVGLATGGKGEPLLLLHGFPHDRTLWAPQLAGDSLGVRRLAPDLPGFGESDSIGGDSVEAWADWVADLLDLLELQRVILGGLSMGGYLAFAFWRRHPTRVRALILADTRAGADSEEGRAKRREMQVLARAQGSAAIAERMMPGMVGKTTRESRPAIVALLDAMMKRSSHEAIISALEVMATRPDSTATLETISVPTLVLCGEEDALTPVAESRAMHAAIRGSQLGIIPAAGHVSNMEDPVTFNGLLSRFLAATIRGTPTHT